MASFDFTGSAGAVGSPFTQSGAGGAINLDGSGHGLPSAVDTSTAITHYSAATVQAHFSEITLGAGRVGGADGDYIHVHVLAEDAGSGKFDGIACELDLHSATGEISIYEFASGGFAGTLSSAHATKGSAFASGDKIKAVVSAGGTPTVQIYVNDVAKGTAFSHAAVTAFAGNTGVGCGSYAGTPSRALIDAWSGGDGTGPSTDVTLTVADASHGHAADATSLVQANTLAVADASHGHAAESPTPSLALTLTPAEAAHAHAAESPSLEQAYTLTIDDATMGQEAESPTLSLAATLTPADADHAHAADAPALTQANTIAPADAVHAHSADQITLSEGLTLAPADALHAHAADGVSLTQAHLLVIADGLHAHTADSPAPSVSFALIVADALHGHAAESPAPYTGILLAVGDGLHGHQADAVILTQSNILTVLDALHAHQADLVVMGDLPEPLVSLIRSLRFTRVISRTLRF